MTEAVVVLAAGKGTRMQSRVPKVLHTLCGTPMISYVIDVAKTTKCSQTILVVPKDNLEIKKVVGDSVAYSVQERPLGTGDALLSAKKLLQSHKDLIVISADVPLLSKDLLNSLRYTHHDTHAVATVVTAQVGSPEGFGRIIRDSKGNIEDIVEHSEASKEQLNITEINAGIYMFDTAWLWDSLSELTISKSGEVYITSLFRNACLKKHTVSDVVAIDQVAVLGINDQEHLSLAENYIRERINRTFMLQGIRMIDPKTVYIDSGVSIAKDTVIKPNTHVSGKTIIGSGCILGPNTVINNSIVGNDCVIESSYVYDSKVKNGVSIGPFSNIRSQSVLDDQVRVGNFTEIKNSQVGKSSRILHLSYIGDAEIGKDVNIGAGTITCNYDGKVKSHTKIGDGALIGSNTMIVAPVNIGIGAQTGAGSVVTKDVPPGATVIGIPARIKKEVREE